MNARLSCIALILVAVASAAFALNPPSASRGPVILLACVVTSSGILEATVDSQSDDRLSCDITCGYELGERMFSHTFTEVIPARFQGRVGEYDTNGARAGNYTGELGSCEKVGR